MTNKELDLNSRLGREWTIHKELPVSPGEIDKGGLALFTKEIKGMKFLDISKGLSNVSISMAEAGADVTCVNMKFGNWENLITEFNFYVDHGFEEQAKKENPYFPTNLIPVAKSSIKESGDKFLGEIKRSKVNVVAATVGDLPLANDTFDYVYCENLISPGLLIDFEVAMNAINEGLRVTKPGGVLEIAAWDTRYSFREPRLVNKGKIVDKLLALGLTPQLFFEPNSPYGMNGMGTLLLSKDQSGDLRIHQR